VQRTCDRATAPRAAAAYPCTGGSGYRFGLGTKEMDVRKLRTGGRHRVLVQA
jgi:hypothetical protein